MLRQFTAKCFRHGKGDVTSVRTVTLTDNDLVRGNDANESVEVFTGTEECMSGIPARKALDLGVSASTARRVREPG